MIWKFYVVEKYFWFNEQTIFPLYIFLMKDRVQESAIEGFLAMKNALPYTTLEILLIIFERRMFPEWASVGGQIQAECSVPAGWNARRQESFQQTDQVA